MKKSDRNIKRTIKALREIIDSSEHDPITARMAYFAETALTWAVEDTVGWKRPEKDLEDEVYLLKKELGRP